MPSRRRGSLRRRELLASVGVLPLQSTLLRVAQDAGSSSADNVGLLLSRELSNVRALVVAQPAAELATTLPSAAGACVAGDKPASPSSSSSRTQVGVPVSVRGNAMGGREVAAKPWFPAGFHVL
jgi:hypothetical protein